jgi:uncharacterized membrane protein YcaP (DUF421 family)
VFELSLPWWELVVRAALIYVALLLFVRMSGKRTVGQFTPFDLLVVMLTSEAVSNSLHGGEESVFGGLIVAATLVGLNMLASFATSRSEKMEHLLEGVPVLLGKDGQAFDGALRRHRVSQGDMQKALRESDCDLSEMASAILEPDGTISIAKRKSGKPEQS